MSQLSLFKRIVVLSVVLVLHSGLANAQANDCAVANCGAPAVNPNPTPAPTVNPGANAARESQLAAANHNMLVAMILFMECQKQKKQELCLLGMLALQQANHLFDAAKKSGDTATASKTDENAGSAQAVVNKVNFSDPRVKEAEKILAKSGIRVDRNGNVHMPDGKVMSGANFSSSQGLAAAGLDPAALDLAQKAVESSDAKISGLGGKALAESFGGGSSSSEASAAYTTASVNSERRGKLMAGKTVIFDGEPIGVKTDNIFEMVHNAYQRKVTGKEFIFDPNGGGDSSYRPDGSK